MKLLPMNFDFLRMLLAIVISTHAAAGETRKWTNNEGKVINAEFVSSDGSEVSAITQSAPPDNHLLGFKVHHLRM